jgi:hypothetical protein
VLTKGAADSLTSDPMFKHCMVNSCRKTIILRAHEQQAPAAAPSPVRRRMSTSQAATPPKTCADLPPPAGVSAYRGWPVMRAEPVSASMMPCVVLACNV